MKSNTADTIKFFHEINFRNEKKRPTAEKSAALQKVLAIYLSPHNGMALPSKNIDYGTRSIILYAFVLAGRPLVPRNIPAKACFRKR